MSVPIERLTNCGFNLSGRIYVRTADSTRFKKYFFTPELGKSLEESEYPCEILIPTKEGFQFIYTMISCHQIYELEEIRFCKKRICIFRNDENNLLKMPYKHRRSEDD